MKKKICLIIFFLFNLNILQAQQHHISSESYEWQGTPAEKVWGLMTIWAQTKFAFPHRDRLQNLDWDNKVQEFIPKVLSANNLDSYYRVLMELTALLRDSHTEVIPPWGRFTPGFDIPPIEIKVINDKFFIIRTGNTDEIKNNNIQPGMEILEVGEGIPVQRFFEENVLKYHSRGSKHANETVLLYYLFYGPQESKVKLKVKDLDEKVRIVELTRNASSAENPPFMYSFVKYSFANSIEHRILPGGILYVNLPNFQSENPKIRDNFLKLIDETDLTAIKGMIIDVRYNLGGSHDILHPIVSSLIDSTVRTPTNHYLEYAGALFAGGEKQSFTWKSRDWSVLPRKGKRYSGPLAILVGSYTHSSGEDLVIELSQRSNCVTIGQKTAGGAGGRYTFSLPGGGKFTMSTFKATYPDGKEYMGTGIQPDIEIYPDLNDTIRGNDIVLEKAKQVLLNFSNFSL